MPRSTTFTWNSRVFIGLAVLLLTATSLTQVRAADMRAITLDIPPQDLDESLRALGLAADRQVLFSADVVAGRRSKAISGTYTAETALAKLLEGTGLAYEERPSGVLMVKAAPQRVGKDAAPPPGDALRARGGEAPAARPTQVAAAETTNTAASRSDRVSVEEIIVTASKRAERLIDTPQAVTVLSGSDLTKIGATQFRDFASMVPGLSFTTAGAGNTQITLRGVTAGSDVGPTVSVYIDEVPFGAVGAFVQANSKILDAALFDLERIEVLRGPQGTLYGASSMGGLIKYVTKMPDTTAVNGLAQAGVSGTQHGGMDYNVGVSANIPITQDKFAARASAYQAHDGGYIRNVARRQDNANRSDTYGGRLDLLFSPTDKLNIRVQGFLQNSNRDGDGTADYTYAGAQPYGSLGQSRALAEPYDQKIRLVSGTVAYDFGPAALTSVSSFQTSRTHYVVDASFAYVPLFRNSFARTFGAVGYPADLGTDKFTQEVRLSSQGTHAVDWQVGGFYTHQTSTNVQFFAFYDLALQPVPSATQQYFFYVNPSSVEEYAGFGDMTWHVTDRFEVMGGLRVARSTQEAVVSGSGALVTPRPSTSSSDTAVTYLANARYHFTDTATGYVRFATGYRPGGPNYGVIDITTGRATSLPPYDSDNLKSYEVGFKATTADRRFSIDLAGYYIDWNNVQLSVSRGGLGVIANAAGATVRGGELAVSATPAEGLTVAGSIAYADAHLSAASTDLRAVSGERLPNVPRITATLSADYVFAVEPWQPSIGATLRHVGDRKSGYSGSTSQHDLPAYTTVDLRAGVVVKAGNTQDVDLQVYVHNVADRRGELGLLLPQFGPRVAVVKPRTFGLSATTRF